MPYVLADRVLETSTTQGTGTINLAGATTGYQSFVDGVGDGNTCAYTIKDGTNWETGIGTVTAGTPDTLSRDTILASSNSDAAVDWGTGTRDVYIAPLADDVLSNRRNETITGNYSFSGSTAFSSAPKLANNVLLNGRNAAGDNDLGIIKLNASDEVELPEGFTVAASKPIDVGANKITNADNPTDPQDVATKGYADGLVSSSVSFCAGGLVSAAGVKSADYNVTSVSKIASGRYSITLTNAMADANYRVYVDSTNAGLNGTVPFVSNKTTTSFSVALFNNNVTTIYGDADFGFDVVGTLA